jgi:CxxC motif-containing protein
MTAQEKNFICIMCPMGCALAVLHDGETVVELTGNNCKRGLAYVQGELNDPRRMVASTVKVRGSLHPLLPVYTAAPFPKGQIFALLAELRKVELQAPVEMEQVVLENALGTGIHVIASRDMPAAGHKAAERDPLEREFRAAPLAQL